MILNRQGFFLPLFKKSSPPDFLSLHLKKKIPLLFQGKKMALGSFFLFEDCFFLHFKKMAIPDQFNFLKRSYFLCFYFKKKIIQSIEWVFLNDGFFSLLHKNCHAGSFFHAYEILKPFTSYKKPNKKIEELCFKMKDLKKKTATLSFDMRHLKTLKKNLSNPLPYHYALPMDTRISFKIPLVLDDFAELSPDRKRAFERYFKKSYPEYKDLSQSQILQKMIDFFWIQ